MRREFIRSPNNVDNIVKCCDVKHVQKLRNWKTLARTFSPILSSSFPSLALSRTALILFAIFPRRLLCHHLEIAVNCIVNSQPWFDQQPSYCTSRSVSKVMLEYSLRRISWKKDARGCMLYTQKQWSNNEILNFAM